MKYLSITICKHNSIIAINDGINNLKLQGYSLSNAISKFRNDYNLKHKHFTKIIDYVA